MLIGYARVSTTEQETSLQLDALRHAGVRTVYTEKTSGVGPRPELVKAMARLQPGQTLVVYKVDRLARSLKDLMALLEHLKGMGCSLRSLTEPMDTSSAMGELVFQILGAVAQFERSMIRERCMAGREAYKARGGRFGPPFRIDANAAAAAATMYVDGLTISQIAAMLGVSYSATRNALVRENVAFRRLGK